MTCDIKTDILSLDRPVPRYTSYPTAPNFQPIEEGQDLPENWLKLIPADDTLSLYLHVPFCPRLCWYCGCHTKITERYAPVEDYAYLVMREIEILANQLKGNGNNNSVTHIHFGGGSPGMLRAVDFDKVMTKLKSNFKVSPSAEISIELDPRNVTEGRVIAYANNGVNRMSLGVQDFEPKVLEAVNRQQPFSLSFDAIKLFRDYGINEINLDLMYGLPYQTSETIQETVRKALSLKPSRVSFFGYAHVPWMKKHMRLIKEESLPNKDSRYDLFEVGAAEMKKAGFEQIGIDHFACPDDAMIEQYREKKLKRNFQGYTTDDAGTLIGIGLSSISQYAQGFVQNAADMPSYKEAILGGRIPAKKYYALTDEDRLRSDIIEQIMCYGVVDVAAQCRRHSVDESHLDQEVSALDEYVGKEFVTVSERKITVCGPAHFLARLVCHAFDGHVVAAKPDEKKHAQAI